MSSDITQQLLLSFLSHRSPLRNLSLDFTANVCVKCNQTGKLFRVKVTALSRCDEECMTLEDLGLTMNNKVYPVSVVSALADATTERKGVSNTILILCSENY